MLSVLCLRSAEWKPYFSSQRECNGDAGAQSAVIVYSIIAMGGGCDVLFSIRPPPRTPESYINIVWCMIEIHLFLGGSVCYGWWRGSQPSSRETKDFTLNILSKMCISTKEYYTFVWWWCFGRAVCSPAPVHTPDSDMTVLIAFTDLNLYIVYWKCMCYVDEHVFLALYSMMYSRYTYVLHFYLVAISGIDVVAAAAAAVCGHCLIHGNI